MNAMRHSLSMSNGRSEIDEEFLSHIVAHLIEDMEQNEALVFHAREVGLSLLELSRVKAAKEKVWNFASCDLNTKNYGILYGYTDELPFFLDKKGGERLQAINA